MIPLLCSRLGKIAICLFIAACLWAMISTNLNLSLARITPDVGNASALGKTLWSIQRAEWYINYLGWAAGLKNYWRMFSPVDRFNWQMVTTAIYDNGTKRILPTGSHNQNTFLKNNFLGFREAKFELNMYNNQSAQNNWAQYLCQQYSTAANRVSSIKIDLASQRILPPKEARTNGSYTKDIGIRDWGEFPCQ